MLEPTGIRREAVGPSPSGRGSRGALLVLAVGVFVLAVWTRWSYDGGRAGSSFQPRPDALEYAAGAQSIAEEGRYWLRIGSNRIRPRYSPGLSLLLAPALRLGVRGDDLWRVGALFGGLLAVVVGGAAALAARRLAGRDSAARAPALVAGALSGSLWALAPIGVTSGITVMSDEVAALFALLGIGATVRSWSRAASLREALGWGLAAGFCLGLLASVRPVGGALLAPPLVVLAWMASRRGSARRTGRVGLAIALGALPPTLLTIWILGRSGWSPWPWSAYSLWFPAEYGPGTTPFALANVLRPGRNLIDLGALAPTNLGLAARLLLGLPGAPLRGYVGLGWPIAAWLAAWPLLARGRRVAGATPLAWAAIAWTGGHLALYTSYFFQAPRFYLPVLTLPAILVGILLGLATLERAPWRRALVGVACAVVLALTLAPHRGLRPLERDAGASAANVRERVEAWLALPDEVRAARTVPFDPVEAQALGVLPAAAAQRVTRWGRLPATPHVRALRDAGVSLSDD